MASYVVTNAGGTQFSTIFGSHPARGSQSATQAVYRYADGSTVVLRGSGFAYSAGVPVAGTVAAMDVFAADGATVLGSAVAAVLPLTDVDTWLRIPVEGVSGALIVAGLQAAGSSHAGWGSAPVLSGSVDDDQFLVDVSAPVVLEPGGGGDVIVTFPPRELTFGEMTGQADPFGGLPVEISYAEHEGPGGVHFALATDETPFIFDPTNGVDVVSGQFGGARMTNFFDVYVGGSLPGFVAGLAGADSMDGGGGYDTVRYDLDAAYGGAAGVYVDLAEGFARDGFGDIDTVMNFEHAVGTNGALGSLPGISDVLLGTDVFNIFAGLGGRDYIDGRDWYDMADYSRDAAYGGTASVHVDLAAGYGRDGFGDFDILLNIEHIRGTSDIRAPGAGVDDLLYGDAGHNMIQGLAGTDLIDGRGGQDTVSYEADAAYGGTSGVIVDIAAGQAIDGFGYGDVLVGIEDIIGTNRDEAGTPGLGDILRGSDGANVLTGLLGNDVLDGRGGDDELVSGAGNDIMTGGAGADLFWFDNLPGFYDRITDFVPGVDMIGMPNGSGGVVLTPIAGGMVMTNKVTLAQLFIHGALSEDDVTQAMVFTV